MPRIVRVSERGRDWIAQLEGGYRLTAYLCPAGVWTISAGVTRYSVKTNARVKKGDKLATIDEAKALFARVLGQFEAGVDALTHDDLQQHEFDALVDFAFNLGIGAYARATLAKWVNERRSAAEIRQQLIRWRFADLDPTHPGLEEAKGLLRRREAEALVYAGGDYLGYDAIARRIAASLEGRA